MIMNSIFNTFKKCCLLPALLLALAAFDNNLFAQDCCDQGGKPSGLTMEYVGGSCSSSNNTQGSKTECDNFGGGLGSPSSVYIVVSEDDDGGGDSYFSGNVDINSTFTADNGGDKFPSKIFFRIFSSQGGALLQRNEIHTSCSADLILGQQFGGLVLQGVLYENGTSCGPPIPPPPPEVCPDPIINVQQGQICAGDQIVFEAPDLGFPCLMYIWDFGFTANPPVATGKGPHVVTFSTDGVVSVSLTIDNGCDGSGGGNSGGSSGSGGSGSGGSGSGGSGSGGSGSGGSGSGGSGSGGSGSGGSGSGGSGSGGSGSGGSGSGGSGSGNNAGSAIGLICPTPCGDFNNGSGGSGSNNNGSGGSGSGGSGSGGSGSGGSGSGGSGSGGSGSGGSGSGGSGSGGSGSGGSGSNPCDQGSGGSGSGGSGSGGSGSGGSGSGGSGSGGSGSGGSGSGGSGSGGSGSGGSGSGGSGTSGNNGNNGNVFCVECRNTTTITITVEDCTGPCTDFGGDSDNDGVCDDFDCAPDDPNFPKPVGTPCNDFDPSTVNDVIQADGCSCAGIFDDCALKGGDTDNDGVCDDDDCAPDDPNFPKPVGTTCNDFDPNTVNDVIQADGCSCAGTPVGCDLDLQILNIVCDGKGTITTTDDTYTFDVLVTGTGTSGQWFGNYSNGFLGAFASGPNAYGVPITLGPFPAGEFTASNISPPLTIFDGLDIDLSVRDLGNPSCTESITVESTGPCSPPPTKGKIGDRVWFDANSNGIQDFGEPGIPNAFVMLTTCNGAFLDFKFTDSNGNYCFTDLDAGNYRVFFANPNGSIYMATQVNQGGNDANDSDPGVDGRTPCIQLGQGEINNDVDAGYKPMGGDPCLGNGGDSDGDGVCDFDDCRPNNPEFPTTPGKACNDGDPNTINDVVQADGCSCAGTPPTVCDNFTTNGKVGFGNSCASSFEICNPNGDFAPIIENCESPTGGSGAIEIIWIRNRFDCSPIGVTVEQMINDPSSTPWEIVSGATGLSLDPGFVGETTCYQRCARRAGCDTYVAETDIVQIIVNPDCGSAGPDCSNIDISTGPGVINISGLNGAPVTSVLIMTAGWSPVFSCYNDCGGNSISVPVSPGAFRVKVKYADANWADLCEVNELVQVANALVASTNFDFDIVKYDEHAELVWVHDGGDKVMDYVVEHSADGISFAEITGQESKGTTSHEVYTDYDMSPKIGDNYYRIRMDLIDGSIGYSTVKRINYANLIDFVLFPNPANEFVKANLETLVGQKEIKISIFNNLGVKVKSFQLDEVYSKYYHMDLRDLREGHYTVWIVMPDGKPLAKQLVIGKI